MTKPKTDLNFLLGYLCRAYVTGLEKNPDTPENIATIPVRLDLLWSVIEAVETAVRRPGAGKELISRFHRAEYPEKILENE